MITSHVKSMLIAYEGMHRWTWNVQLPMQGAVQGWMWFNFRIINLLIKSWGTGGGYAWPGLTVTTVQNKRIERVKFTCTPNGKPEFVPRDQVFPLVVVYCLLLLLEINIFTPVLSIRIVLDNFYLLIFYFEEFSTWIWRLPFAANVTLNLPNLRN